MSYSPIKRRRIKSFIIISFTALILAGAVVAASNERPQTIKHDPQKKDSCDQQNICRPFKDNTIPASQNIGGGAQEYSEYENHHSGERIWLWLKGWIVKFVNDPISVFTLFLLIVSWLQWIKLDDSVRVAQESADAAKGSVDAFRRLERAYIFVNIESEDFEQAFYQLTVNNVANNQQQPSVGFSFINTGQTPAIVKRMSSEIDLVMKDRIGNDVVYSGWHNIKVEKIIRGGAVSPTTVHTLAFPILNASIVAELRNANMFIRFFGIIEYEDVFGQQQETSFYWIYNALAQSFGPHHIVGKQYNRRT